MNSNYKYIDSNKIIVFPAGFRSADFPSSKLSTERNLTLLSRAARKYNAVFRDLYNSNILTIVLRGYIFQLDVADVPAGKLLYAGISLRKLSDADDASANEIGEILTPVDTTLGTTALDMFIDDSATASSFIGLTFSEQPFDAMYQILIRDENGELVEFDQENILSSMVIDVASGKSIDKVFTTDKLVLPKLSPKPGILKVDGSGNVKSEATIVAKELAATGAETSPKYLQESGLDHTLTWVSAPAAPNVHDGALSVGYSNSSEIPNVLFTANQATNSGSQLLFDKEDFLVNTTNVNSSAKSIVTINPNKSFEPTSYIKSATVGNNNTLILTPKSGQAINFQASSVAVSSSAPAAIAGEAKYITVNNNSYKLVPTGLNNGEFKIKGLMPDGATSIDERIFSANTAANGALQFDGGDFNVSIAAGNTGVVSLRYWPIIRISDSTYQEEIQYTSAQYPKSTATFELKNLTTDGSPTFRDITITNAAKVGNLSVIHPTSKKEWFGAAPNLVSGGGIVTAIDGTTTTFKLESKTGNVELFTGNLTLDRGKVIIKNDDLQANQNITCGGDIDVRNTITAGEDITTVRGRFIEGSDKRLKENIQVYESKKSILDLPIVKFDYKDGAKNQIGCIAQDLKKICPELVVSLPSGYLGIQESKLIYLLIDEVKKLKQEIDKLKENK